ncbi:hypothetical protein ACFWGI_28355 [Streptomyces niveus]|uniref:hypothetical protein n=1 Tax=Streptomyces niveus TaxID=193462 RepID=UPI0036675302
MVNTPAYLVPALLPALLVGIACYVLLRWAAVPLLVHLERGMEYAVNVVVVGLLLPEYCWTRAQRRVSGHVAPFAYTYGDAVCTVAAAGHRCVSTVAWALREAANQLGHRGALWGGLIGAGALLWSSRP